MMESAETGEPYPSDRAGPVDDWSEAIYEALRHWNIAQGGKWTRWDPGYLLLTIARLGANEIDPIQIYTADEELTVEFGYWITHNPTQLAPYEVWEISAQASAEQAEQLVERWLHGEMLTGVVKDAMGKWCGTTLIKPGDLAPQLKEAAQWARPFKPAQIEVRTPNKADWKIYPIEPDWMREPAHSELDDHKL